MCILLVEDERSVREVLAEALAEEGFEVCEATTSDQAARLIERLSTVILLLMTDIDLPGDRDGFGLARLMHRKLPSLPVIYITGRPDRVEALGPKEVTLIKPFTFRSMICAIQHLLSLGCVTEVSMSQVAHSGGQADEAHPTAASFITPNQNR